MSEDEMEIHGVTYKLGDYVVVIYKNQGGICTDAGEITFIVRGKLEVIVVSDKAMDFTATIQKAAILRIAPFSETVDK